ncbi:MAG: T9SS type A sorting domain-containing protein [Methanoregulaceae archaeon]|nr:T9SS type A sorting domain-containing protein [Methanoregulaceae archaeon]
MDKDKKDEYVFINYAPDYGVWVDDVPLKVLEIDVVGTDVRVETDVLPSETRLMQNYPNPFNPSTTIRYELASAVDVRLGVFDMLGRRIAMLEDGIMGGGTHARTWDGTNAAGVDVGSGVYMCRLSASGVSGRSFTGTQRMLLVR